jgi:hypothetical protein
MPMVGDPRRAVADLLVVGVGAEQHKKLDLS